MLYILLYCIMSYYIILYYIILYYIYYILYIYAIILVINNNNIPLHCVSWRLPNHQMVCNICFLTLVSHRSD